LFAATLCRQEAGWQTEQERQQIEIQSIHSQLKICAQR